MSKRSITKARKRQNIPLRRKIAIIYARLTIALRILIGILLYLILFTTYLPNLRHEIAHNLYEFTADLGFILENVLIEGQHNTSPTDILAALNASKGTTIASINLKEVRNSIERNRWIKTATVERRLPNTIYIAILERVPIAIWQNNKQLFLIDNEGFTITDKHLDDFAHLLHVVGVDANIYVSKLLEDLAKYPELLSQVISSVRYGERRWNLNLQQDITIKMPETNFDQALHYLVALHKAGKLFDQNYKIIDMRDSTKYYIEKYDSVQ